MDKAELILAMKQVAEFSADLQTTSWLWGGLTADIYAGCLLRNHHDLDYLTLNLHTIIEPLTQQFLENGWEVKRLSNGDLGIKKEEVKIHLGNVLLSREAQWTHNGDLGSLFFPLEWLARQTRRFYKLDVHVVAPEFQYVLLTHPELLDPTWKPRAKDVVAKDRLKTILEVNNIHIAGLRNRIHN
jgi:hypothetical protein